MSKDIAIDPSELQKDGKLQYTPQAVPLHSNTNELPKLFASLDINSNNLSDVIIDPKEVTPSDKIGAGTYGEVWKAIWREEPVAVKKINLQGAKQELVQQLMVELCNLIRTRHPRLLQYYGVCFVSNVEIWIVMEYADGGTLNTLVTTTKAAKQTFSSEQQWDMAFDIVSALEFLHSRTIIHKFLNSSNILIVKGELKVSDYGMLAAAIIHTQLALTNRTQVGTARTACCIAPELATSKKPEYSEKTDVFSLGMVLWEIVEQSIPFPTQDQIQVIQTLKTERPYITSTCPDPLKKLIQLCWDGDAPKRPELQKIRQIIQENRPQHVGPAVLTPKAANAPRAHKPVHAYFGVNHAELVCSVSKGQITVLDKPPKFPIPDVPTPPIPDKIEIVTLYAPPMISKKVAAQFLRAEKYEHRIFNRVRSYFHSFYIPSDPALEAQVDRIEVILNPYVEQKYAKMNDLFESKFKGLFEFRPTNQNEQQQHYLEYLLTSKNLVADKKANPIAAWYRVPKDPAMLESICWYGLLDRSSTDPGYFGRGIYVTQMPKYGEYYAGNVAEKKEGSFSLLLCWALVGRPFAVTKVSLASKPILEHSSYYVVVTKKLADKKFFCKKEDYLALEGRTTYFPLDENEKANEIGDEIVLFDADQVMPRYIVHYTVGKKVKLPRALVGAPREIQVLEQQQRERELEQQETKQHAGNNTTNTKPQLPPLAPAPTPTKPTAPQPFVPPPAIISTTPKTAKTPETKTTGPKTIVPAQASRINKPVGDTVNTDNELENFVVQFLQVFNIDRARLSLDHLQPTSQQSPSLQTTAFRQPRMPPITPATKWKPPPKAKSQVPPPQSTPQSFSSPHIQNFGEKVIAPSDQVIITSRSSNNPLYATVSPPNFGKPVPKNTTPAPRAPFTPSPRSSDTDPDSTPPIPKLSLH